MVLKKIFSISILIEIFFFILMENLSICILMENWGDKCKKWFSLLSLGLAAYPGGGEQMGQYLKGRHCLDSNFKHSRIYSGNSNRHKDQMYQF